MKSPTSSKPRKQRKFIHQAPLHLKRHMLASHLSEELREKYKRRAFPIRKGDEVKVMRGEFKGHVGKVLKVDVKHLKVYVEGVTVRRSDGSVRLKPLHASKLMILKLNLDDKRRVKAIERRLKAHAS